MRSLWMTFVVLGSCGVEPSAIGTEATELDSVESELHGSGRRARRCAIELKRGTYGDLASVLEAQPWYGNEASAKVLAELVGDRLGLPNGPAPGAGQLGPLFAVSRAPAGCGAQGAACTSWSGQAISERDPKAGQFSETLVPTVPPNSYTFAIFRCGKPSK
jgi:hypothetical protein